MDKAENAAQTQTTGIAAGVPTGKSGKGRAAKRQRLQRAQAVQATTRLVDGGVGEDVNKAGEDASKAGETANVGGMVKSANVVSGRCESPLSTRSTTSTASSARSSRVTIFANSRNALSRTQPRDRPRWAAAQAARTPLDELAVGAMREGAKVTGIQPYGAFVDIGAAKDGLLPVRAQMEGALALGQRLAAVYVAHVDLSRGRVTLSLAPPGGDSSRKVAHALPRYRLYSEARGSEMRCSNTSTVSSISSISTPATIPPARAQTWLPRAEPKSPSVVEPTPPSVAPLPQPTSVDEETLAARLQWKMVTAELSEAEAPPIATQTLRRLPGGGAFRRIALVQLPWKHMALEDSSRPIALQSVA